MRRLLALAAVAVVSVAVAVGGDQLVTRDAAPGSTAKRTAYSFAYAVGHHNFGRACSYVALKTKKDPAACSQGLTYNAAFSMVLFGVDIFDGARIVPGSEHPNADGSVTYQIVSDNLPATDLRIAKQADGRWRIVRIG